MNYNLKEHLQDIGLSEENAIILADALGNEVCTSERHTAQLLGKKLLELLKGSKESFTQEQVVQYIDLSQLTIGQLRYKQAALVAGRKGRRNEVDKLMEDIKEIDAELEAVHIAKVSALVKTSN